MADFDEDNLMPNDGTYFGIPKEPADQQIARKKEKAQTLEALSLSKEILAHFQDRIDALGKLDSIKVSITTKPADFQKAFLVNKLLTQAMVEEKEILEEKLEMYGPK